MQKHTASVFRHCLVAIVALAGSRAATAAVHPCTDGVVYGDLTAYYQTIQGDLNHNGTLDGAETPTAFYTSLSADLQAMVNCGADASHTVPDIFIYNLRPPSAGGLVRNKEGQIIARVYDYLDPDTRRYYVAVVLDGCYTDNVIAKKSVNATDESYLASVYWDVDHPYDTIEGSDKFVGNLRCNDASGTAVYDFQGIELDLISLVSGSSDSAEDAVWGISVEKPKAPGFPAAMNFKFGTSAYWNMALRKGLKLPVVGPHMASEHGVAWWDLEDQTGGTCTGPGGTAPCPDGVDERPSSSDWKSPYISQTSLWGDLGYASTWFDQQHLYDWQHVYEYSFDVPVACGNNPLLWQVEGTLNTHSSPAKSQIVICGQDANQGTLTVIKDSIPDDPWDKYDFFVTGPTPAGFRLQDWGSNECAAGLELPDGSTTPDCSNTAAWTYPDHRTFANMLTTSSAIFGGKYQVEELNPEPDYGVEWECKNVAVPLSATCNPNAPLTFDFDACAAVAPACAAGTPFATGQISSAVGGVSPQTAPFDLCPGAHVICRFKNIGGQESESVCLETENAIGDLQVLGGVEPNRVSFTTAALPTSSADAPDSMFLASFVPIADQSRWAGTVDHFIQPLPVVEDASGNLVPDKSQTCVDVDDTACLAWDAAVEILSQAPDSSEVLTDRQIGTAAAQRRVAYTKAAAVGAVPRSLRAFDYSDADPLAEEYELWRGMGISFVEGDTDSETSSRAEARSIIRQTLQERTVTILDPDTGDPESVTYVTGDIFHGDPLQLGGPSNFFYLANDLEGNGKACDDAVDPNPGYRCFFEKHQRRRKVLLAPSNDGQLHAFDAGIYHGSVVQNELVGEFDFGTGKELFAQIPRPMLAHTRNLVTLEHAFGIDGPLQADDVFVDPAHAGTPTSSEREWRSVVIGTYREGGRGLYALDLTQPDPLDVENVVDFAGQPAIEYVPTTGSSYVPACSALSGSLPAGCGQPYPAVLWEFEDQCSVVDLDTGLTLTFPCDDDANGYPDLGFSWSKVNTGRVLVIPDGATDPVVKFVAIFGGGLDPANPGLTGNFLYMVDIETGKLLYKRALTGAVPSEPAAVDTDANGILDTLYIGTTAGLLYKVDISQPGDLDATSGRVDDVAQWVPFPVFDTEGREIFFRPTVVFEANSGHYALAFGTGDRQDLWSEALAGEEGRFYLILDPGFVEGIAPLASGPLTETDFEQIPVAADASTGNFLLAPVGDNLPGWVLQLGADERVVTDALSISGFLAFTTFDPDRPDLCSFGGNGKIYGLLATNANAIAGGEAERAIAVEGFAGEPVVTREGFSRQDGQGGTIDPFEASQLQAIRQSLIGLFPADCRFGNFSLNVSTSLSGSQVLPLAQIPVCVARKNWTDH